MDINKILDRSFSFTRRNQLIPTELRPIWKASIVLLIFNILSRNGCCSLKKIHIANWIVMSESHVENFLYWTNDTTGVRPDIRMEPAIDRIVEIMVGEKFLEKIDGKLKITEDGLLLALKIQNYSIFEVEKSRLSAVKKFMTETNVERVFKVT